VIMRSNTIDRPCRFFTTSRWHASSVRALQMEMDLRARWRRCGLRVCPVSSVALLPSVGRDAMIQRQMRIYRKQHARGVSPETESNMVEQQASIVL
jgi:hypothetical protein